MHDQDKQIIEQYCKDMKINVNYNIKPNFNDNKQKMTVAMWLANNNQNIPQQWFHDPTLQNNRDYTVAMIMAKNNTQIPKQWEHDPSIQSSFDFATVALLQASNGHIPDQIWQHNKYLRIKYKQTYKSVQCLLQERKIDVPAYWQYNFVENDKQENTQAMIQVKQGIIPEKQYYHDPEQTNVNGETVALLLILNKILPPLQWMYDIDKQLQHKITLRSFLEYQNLPVPQHWNKNENFTIFDQAFYGTIPQSENHNPTEQDQYGFTVAMILASNISNSKLTIPQCWYHDPNIQNCHGFTVALYYAYQGLVPPHEWEHDKLLKVYAQYNNVAQYYTVQDLLQTQNIQVPPQWQY